MNELKKIVWLASYPKSGNTWFRAFLTAFDMSDKVFFSINHLYSSIIASSRELFDDTAGIYSSDLTADEIDLIRPEVYRQNAQNAKNLIFHKTHDAWTILPNGQALFPAEITRAVIYIIRNPLDIAVSFSHHLSVSIERTIEAMNNPNYSFCQKNKRLYAQLRQSLLSWSGHVISWTIQSNLPVIVIRYEDLQLAPVETFTKALHFIGIKTDRDKIESAVRLSSFDKLKEQEKESGFSEKAPDSESFFRKGIVGDWRNELTNAQVQKLIDEHKSIMLRYGYL